MEYFINLLIILALAINVTILCLLIYLYKKYNKYEKRVESVKALEDILHNDDDFGRIHDTNIYTAKESSPFVVSTGRRDKTTRTW